MSEFACNLWTTFLKFRCLENKSTLQEEGQAEEDERFEMNNKQDNKNDAERPPQNWHYGDIKTVSRNRGP